MSDEYGLFVRHLLKERNLKPADLARRLKVSRQSVGQILQGARAPGEDTTSRIAKALGVPAAQFPVAATRSRRSRVSRLPQMPAVDVAALDLVLQGVAEARHHLLEQEIGRLLAPAVGKADTLALDSEAEIIVADHLRRLSENTVVLTEERSQSHAPDPSAMYFIMDPFDRSKPFASRLRELAGKGKESKRVYDVLPELRASMTGALGSPFIGITFVRGLKLRFTVLADYLSNEMIVACPAFVKVAFLDLATPESFEAEGEDLVFDARDGFAAVFFPGNERHSEDRRRLASALKLEEHAAVSDRPGGPARVLALAASGRHAPWAPNDIAVVASVGEKLTEFIHWVAVAVHSRSLAVYELSPEGTFAQDGLLLAPSPRYSIFTRGPDGSLGIDEHILCRFGSGYRGCIAVTQLNSRSANARLRSLPFCRELVTGNQMLV